MTFLEAMTLNRLLDEAGGKLLNLAHHLDRLNYEYDDPAYLVEMSEQVDDSSMLLLEIQRKLKSYWVTPAVPDGNEAKEDKERDNDD